MKSKDTNKSVSVKDSSLGQVISENEKIEESIKDAANELASINQVIKKKNPIEIIEQAIVQNENVEHKVEQASADLKLVNASLSKELAERIVLESELADTKTDLAEVRDDLLKSQIKEEEAQKIALQDALTGLPNRVSFEQGLDYGLIQAKRQGWGLDVLVIDIDKF